MSYSSWSKKVKACADETNMKQALTSGRKRLSKVRDKVVLFKMVWGEAQSFLGPVQSMIIFLGLTTASILALNAAIRFLASAVGISTPWQFPLEIASFFLITLVVVIMVMGYVSVRYFGTQKSANELSTLMNPGMYALDESIGAAKDEILKEINNVKDRLKLLEDKK